MTETITRKVPAAALEFRLPCEFVRQDQTDPLRGRVRLTARSNEPVDHSYWGLIVHDMAGMQHKPRVPLDWFHNQNEPIGYADKFDVSNGDLRIEGELIATSEQDRAAMVLAKGRAGIPFEASIKFDPHNLTLEEVPEGFQAEVNGRTLAGPLVIARQWRLRGVAMCLYGYDPGTQANFAAEGGREFELSIFRKETPVSKTEHTDAALTELADGQTQTPPETPDDSKAEFKALLTDYTSRFGAERAAEWVAADKPLVDCYAEFVEQLRTQHAAELDGVRGELQAAQTKVTEQQSKLDQLGNLAAGEQDPLSSEPAGQNDKASERAAELAPKLGEGLAKFAAGLQMPKGKATKESE